MATALEKHEGSLLEKGFTILKSELAANMYEAINGPHFDEEHAHYAVEGMENEDGTKGPHWTVEETTSVANQMGINLKSEKHKESLSKIDEEMRRCEDILKILNINSDITTNVTKDFKELDDLKAEVKELKQLLQNVSAVRPEVIKNTPPNSAEDKKVEPEGEIKKEI